MYILSKQERWVTCIDVHLFAAITQCDILIHIPQRRVFEINDLIVFVIYREKAKLGSGLKRRLGLGLGSR